MTIDPPNLLPETNIPPSVKPPVAEKPKAAVPFPKNVTHESPHRAFRFFNRIWKVLTWIPRKLFRKISNEFHKHFPDAKSSGTQSTESVGKVATKHKEKADPEYFTPVGEFYEVVEEIQSIKWNEEDAPLDLLLKVNQFHEMQKEIDLDQKEKNDLLKPLKKQVKEQVRNHANELFPLRDIPEYTDLVDDILSAYGIYQDAISDDSSFSDIDEAWPGMEEAIAASKAQPNQSRPVSSYDWQAVGMINHDNACYRISSLQALSVMEPFMRKLYGELERRQASFPPETETMYAERLELARLLRGVFDTKIKGGTPEQIAQQERKFREFLFNSRINPGEFRLNEMTHQQDAGAFVLTLLNNMLNLNLGQQEILSGTLQGVGAVQEEKLQTPLSPVLTVPLGNPGDSFQTLFDHLFEVEDLESWDYEGIVVESPNKQTVLVGDPPEFLTVQLQRSFVEGDFEIKNTAEVELANDHILDLAKAYQRNEPIPYKLKSFVYHIGDDFHHGHYVSFVQKDGTWYLCDDEKIYYAPDELVQQAQKTAYLYFFEKVSTEHV